MKIAPGTDRLLPSGRPATADRTRDAVARLVLERGPQSAADLARELNLSAAAIRRHLDALTDAGLLVEHDPKSAKRGESRGRGRPARVYALTDSGRAAFPHEYDDLATTALRYLRATGGEQAVVDFARHRADGLAALLEDQVDTSAPVDERVRALADALNASGYAANSTPAATGNTEGTQVCQHHCPVAHVAAEFPELCEAETRAFEAVLGTHVQRLATIGHGDTCCTTYVPTTSTTKESK